MFVVRVQLALCGLLCFVSNAALAPVDPKNCGLPEETVNELKEVFDVIDHNEDGKVTIDDIREVMIENGEEPTEEGLAAIAAELDAEGSGSICFEQFLGLVTADLEAEEKRLKEKFSLFDKNGDGYISQDELREFLTGSSEEPPRSLINRLLKALSNNQDGVVYYNDFKKVMKVLF